MENILEEHLDQLPKKGQIVWVRDSDEKRWGIAHFIDYYTDSYLPYKVSQRNNPDDCVLYKCLRTTNPYEMNSKQTAVDWLEDKIINYNFNQGMAQMRKYILEARQMHKEQIGRGYQEGLIDGMNHSPKDYYNETYEK
jgi:hypothetical protein